MTAKILYATDSGIPANITRKYVTDKSLISNGILRMCIAGLIISCIPTNKMMDNIADSTTEFVIDCFSLVESFSPTIFDICMPKPCVKPCISIELNIKTQPVAPTAANAFTPSF